MNIRNSGLAIMWCVIFFSVSVRETFAQNTHAQSAQKKKKKTAEISIYDVDTLGNPVPKQRQLFHDRIDRAQVGADYTDGVKDSYIDFGGDSLYSAALTQSLLKDVDQIQVMIENLPIADKQAENQNKIRYLQAVWNLLQAYNKDTRVDPFYYKKSVNRLRGLIIARQEGKLSEYVKEHADKYTMANIGLLDGYAEGRTIVYTEVGKAEPLLLIRKLGDFANESFACDVIASAAKVAPNEVYAFASSTDSRLSGAVRRCQDPLVQSIVRIATESKAPLKAMAFLSDIHNGRKTIQEIDVITADQDLFYKNLVRLKLEGETLGGDTYTDELAYRGLRYVRIMNDLHESPDAVRFKCIDNMTPAELYFMMVYGQDEIYTSSFLGTFNRMMQRRGTMSGDSLLGIVRYDRFRTFIRMCAGYNKLGEFLATIDESKKNSLMRDFIANLEQGKEDDLEDAVDVADAFGSIDDKNLQLFLQGEVRSNYERVSTARSKKGLIVYGLLATLFKSFIDGEITGDSLGLPTVNKVPYKNLTNDSGVVYEQFFFYGDEDGKNSYASFLGDFAGGKWKQTNNKSWTEFRSIAGKPVVVFANLPIPEPGDEEAQAALKKYLGEQNIQPSFVIHRGHSYHLPTTIENLSKSSRIVMLGSCGGYHNLGTVLDHSPDAQIISTKQTGTMVINDLIIRTVQAQILAGNDIDWVKLWASLEASLQGKSDILKTFHEYVPPHRNLGAIFIKAYRRISNSQDEES